MTHPLPPEPGSAARRPCPSDCDGANESVLPPRRPRITYEFQPDSADEEALFRASDLLFHAALRRRSS